MEEHPEYVPHRLNVACVSLRYRTREEVEEHFYRAGNCVCEQCGKDYRRHPFEWNTLERITPMGWHSWLHVLCNGDVVKL